jgi:hypothetical protein
MRHGRLVTVLAAGAFLLTAGPAAAQVLPVGTWSFNEGTGSVAHETSLRPDNGAIQGDASWIKGRFWNALSFGGAGAVDIPDRANLDPADVTVSAWVNNDTSPGKFKYILVKGASGCTAGAYALYTGAKGGLEFYVSNNGGLTYTISPDAGTDIWDGQWHSVVGTFDGSAVRLYVDGKQVGTGTDNSTPIDYGLSTSSDLMIGKYAGCGGLNFSGAVDEVHIFNRALGAPEIHLGYVASQYLPQRFPDDAVL